MNKNEMTRIILCADDLKEFDWDIWERYCGVCGVSCSTEEITIYFKSEDATNEKGIRKRNTRLPEMNYIFLYADEFKTSVWKEYCDICGVSCRSILIRIIFDENDVETVGIYDEEEIDDEE